MGNQLKKTLFKWPELSLREENALLLPNAKPQAHAAPLSPALPTDLPLDPSRSAGPQEMPRTPHSPAILLATPHSVSHLLPPSTPPLPAPKLLLPPPPLSTPCTEISENLS